MSPIAKHPESVATSAKERPLNSSHPVASSMAGVAIRDARPVAHLSRLEKLKSNALQIVQDRISMVEENSKGKEKQLHNPLELIKQAFLSQHHLIIGEKDEFTEKIVIDMDNLTTEEFAAEHIARVILFSPMAADAARENRVNTHQLSRFNDMLTDCIESVSPTILENLQSIIEEGVQWLNETYLFRDYDFSSEIEGRLRGVIGEVAVVRALKTNAGLKVTIPGTSGDLQGKDITVDDGRSVAHIDVKRNTAFKTELNKLMKPVMSDSSLSEEQINQKLKEAAMIAKRGYFATRQDEDGGWKYIINADKFGTIQGLEYDESGASAIIELIQSLLVEDNRDE